MFAAKEVTLALKLYGEFVRRGTRAIRRATQPPLSERARKMTGVTQKIADRRAMMEQIFPVRTFRLNGEIFRCEDCRGDAFECRDQQNSDHATCRQCGAEYVVTYGGDRSNP